MKTQIIENSDEIIIRSTPVKEWFIAGILAFVFGIFSLWLILSILYNPNFLSEKKEHTWFEMFPFLLLGAVSVFMIIFDINLKSIFFAPLTSVIIDRKTVCIDILYHRLHNTGTQKFYFNQIEKFKSYKEKRNYLQVLQGKEKFSSTYFLALILANQKEIKLKISIGEDKNETVKFIKRLNKIIKSKSILPKDGN